MAEPFQLVLATILRFIAAMRCDTTKGFLFDECGPVCPKTCENRAQPLGEITPECLKPCEPSCQCPAGLVQHNGRCMPADLCPEA